MYENNVKTALAALHDERLKSFWNNLKEGFQKFEETKELPKIRVASDGTYVFN